MVTSTDPQQTSILPIKDDFIKAFKVGEVKLQGQFINSSNATFLVDILYADKQWNAVYKPTRGESPLWDFPPNTLAKREVAACFVSKALGWDLVPHTIFRHKAPLGPGSLQLYIEHDPDYHYFNFTAEDKARLKPVVVFDCLVNNADRKGSHILKDNAGSLYLIDHGICFNEEDKLRTVLWDFAGEPIPADLLANLQKILDDLDQSAQLTRSLKKYLQPAEITALANRARHILLSGHFPLPSETHRPYPWPPV